VAYRIPEPIDESMYRATTWARENWHYTVAIFRTICNNSFKTCWQNGKYM